MGIYFILIVYHTTHECTFKCLKNILFAIKVVKPILSGVLSGELRGIRRCSLVGIVVALLEAICHWGWALGFRKAQSWPSVFLFWLL